jgi:hypothetical protein
LSWPLQVDVFQGGAAIDDDSARSTSDERGEQTVASQVVHDPALADADEEAEPLESIEESRPDDLDEFVETNSGREKSIDIEELSESPDGSVLGDDGEIDWTTQAD